MFAYRVEVEKDMNFLGLLIMKNQVKPESAEVIHILKLANLRPVMVTGMPRKAKPKHTNTVCFIMICFVRFFGLYISLM